MNKDSLRARLAALLLIWFLGGISLLYMATFISQWYIVAVLIFAVAHAISAHHLLKCPKCRKNVTLNLVKIGGIEIWLYTPWIPEKCSHCGEEID